MGIQIQYFFSFDIIYGEPSAQKIVLSSSSGVMTYTVNDSDGVHRAGKDAYQQLLRDEVDPAIKAHEAKPRYHASAHLITARVTAFNRV